MVEENFRLLWFGGDIKRLEVCRFCAELVFVDQHGNHANL